MKETRAGVETKTWAGTHGDEPGGGGGEREGVMWHVLNLDESGWWAERPVKFTS